MLLLPFAFSRNDKEIVAAVWGLMLSIPALLLGLGSYSSMKLKRLECEEGPSPSLSSCPWLPALVAGVIFFLFLFSVLDY